MPQYADEGTEERGGFLRRSESHDNKMHADEDESRGEGDKRAHTRPARNEHQERRSDKSCDGIKDGILTVRRDLYGGTVEDEGEERGHGTAETTIERKDKKDEEAERGAKREILGYAERCSQPISERYADK